MKITFDADTLSEELALIKTLPNPRAKMHEDVVGIRAHEATLTAYAYARNQFARVTLLNKPAEEDGVYMIPRARFFQLLETLKGNVVLRPSTNSKVPNRAEVNSKQGKFTLVAYKDPTIPIMRLAGNITRTQVPAAGLRRLMKLCKLDGELLGGGYKVARINDKLEILVSDGLRLLLARVRCPGKDFEFTVDSNAIRGVDEMLKLAGATIILGSDRNLSCLELGGDDISYEFGFTKHATPFPNVDKILNAPTAPNGATFEVEELLDAVQRSIILADKELAFADFIFDGETCKLETMTEEASADIIVDAQADITEDKNAILRLRLDFVVMFLKKLKEAGSTYVSVTWGERLPVNWIPDVDEMAEADIDFRLICTALNRQGVTMA